MLRDHNVQTTIILPREMQTEIQEYRKETGMPMTRVIRIALRDFLDKQKTQACMQEQQN